MFVIHVFVWMLRLFIFTLFVSPRKQVNVHVIHIFVICATGWLAVIHLKRIHQRNNQRYTKCRSNQATQKRTIPYINMYCWCHRESGQFILIFFKQNRKIELIADVLEPLIWRFWRVNMDNEISSFVVSLLKRQWHTHTHKRTLTVVLSVYWWVEIASHRMEVYIWCTPISQIGLKNCTLKDIKRQRTSTTTH